MCVCVFSTLLTHPLDVIRARLAVEPGRVTVGVVGMAKRLLIERNGSPRALFTGLSPALMGIVPYRYEEDMWT